MKSAQTENFLVKAFSSVDDGLADVEGKFEEVEGVEAREVA